MIYRRTFFKYMTCNILVAIDEIRGIPQLKLSDLEELPVEQIKRIIPKIDDRNIYFIERGILWSKDRKTMTVKNICEIDPVEQTIFKRFSGIETVGEIALWASEHHNLIPEEGFRITSEFFIRLAKNRVCFPGNRV